MKLFLTIIAFFYALPCFAQQPGTATISPAVNVVNADKIDYKDAFLKLVLDKATKYSDKAENAIGKAVDLATEEAPILMKEFLRWRFLKNLIEGLFAPILFIVGLISLLLTLRPFVKNCNSYKEGSDCSSVLYGIPCVGGGAIAFFSFLTILMGDSLSQIMICVQIYAAPRIYIIEQASELIKKH